jgi:UDP-N-acetylmuramoyl-L-alanyl-D-glutamate--2,6-diaminopimelate ligase
MEVSSHALDQHRTDAVRFAAGLFTNLTPDHLDYHHTMDSYFDAKARLYESGQIRVGVVNRDDPWGQKLLQRVAGRGIVIETFGAGDATKVELSPRRSRFRWEGRDVTLNVGGRFNVLNAIAAATCARAFGIDPSTIGAGLESVTGIAGRFELVDAGQPFTVIVDYAHTPDGVTRALEAARELTQDKLIVVLGAGGDRDHDKRPLMGAAAARLADLAVFTSDNPRSEDPGSIIDQVVAGAVGRQNVVVDPDRAAAIATALANAQPGDVVVIAGKGHERGQVIGSAVLPFDDVEVATTALRRILASRGDAG